MLAAWVSPEVREVARVEAAAACMEFSRWVEWAVRRAFAEEVSRQVLRDDAEKDAAGR